MPDETTLSAREAAAAPTSIRQNPFLSFLKEAGSRVLAVPGNAIRLPGQIARSVFTGADGRAVAAQNTQADLREQVTGESFPFSAGRAATSTLSLGLIPSFNKSNELDPNTLTGDQRERFNELTPLQQQLLTAKRPQDFAQILTQDEFFSGPAPQPLVPVPNQGALFDPNTGEQAFRNTPAETVAPDHTFIPAGGGGIEGAFQAPSAPTVLDEGQRVVGAQGETRAENPFRPRVTLIPPEHTAVTEGQEDEAFRAAPALRDQSTVVPKDGVLVDRATGAPLYANIEEIDPAVVKKSFADSNTTYDNESTLRSQVQQELRIDQQAAKKYQTAAAAFQFSNNDEITPELREQAAQLLPTLEGAVRSTDSAAALDIVQIFAFMMAMEPQGIVREGEQQMLRLIEGVFGEEAASKMWNSLRKGETFSNEARIQLQEAMFDQLQGRLQGYESGMREFRKIALRSYPAVDNAQSAAPDLIRDYRAAIAMKRNPEMDPRDAPLLPADEEALGLLAKRFRSEYGRDPQDLKEEQAFLRSQGFRAL